MNQVLLIGNLGMDPELRTTQTGVHVCNARVATNEKYNTKEGEEKKVTDWHNIVAWGYHADDLAKMKKGDAIFLTGKTRTRKWEDKDGQTRYATEVVIDHGGQLGASVSGKAAAVAPAQEKDVLDEEVPF